jgi:hypothetical protein
MWRMTIHTFLFRAASWLAATLVLDCHVADTSCLVVFMQQQLPLHWAIWVAGEAAQTKTGMLGVMSLCCASAVCCAHMALWHSR